MLFILFALSIVLIRTRAGKDTALQILILQVVIVSALIVPASIPFWEPVDLSDLPLIASAGVGNIAANFCMIWALTRLAAARVAILDYTSLVWAALLGWRQLAEVLTVATIVDGIVIVCGCLVSLTSSRTKLKGDATSNG